MNCPICDLTNCLACAWVGALNVRKAVMPQPKINIASGEDVGFMGEDYDEGIREEMDFRAAKGYERAFM
jgi:hypothetical protein